MYHAASLHLLKRSSCLVVESAMLAEDILSSSVILMCFVEFTKITVVHVRNLVDIISTRRM